jgi:dihydrofolate reductase
MSKITVMTNLTLDGVMQAPARPDEDTRDGFAHGGWAAPYDAMMALFSPAQSGGHASGTNAFLFGRQTYENFYAVWPNRGDNPFTAVFDNTQKYVASTTLHEPLPWRNSTLLQGDATDAVAALKEQQPGTDFLLFGSGVLVQSLMRANLIDEYVLLIHPLVLGSGRRLFPEGGTAATLRLVSTQTTPTGVIIATYHPADASQS